MRFMYKSIVAVILSLLVGFAPAMADDWRVVRLRGHAFTLDNGAWDQLARGDVVSDDRVIRTASNGRVALERDGESIDVGPDSIIQIQDRTGRRFTTVQQHAGEVTIDANVENVEHFSVQNRFLAAVVKGTRFSVSADEQSAEVKVIRGRVQVRDEHHNAQVSITPGQSAIVSSSAPLVAAGQGVEAVVAIDQNRPMAQPASAVAEAAQERVRNNPASEDDLLAASSQLENSLNANAGAGTLFGSGAPNAVAASNANENAAFNRNPSTGAGAAGSSNPGNSANSNAGNSGNNGNN